MGKVILLMKRCDHADKVQIVLQKIRQEHSLFKYKMLSSPVSVVYDNCNKIRFYECVHEYFQYKEKLDDKFIDAVQDKEEILGELYKIYLKYEYLEVSTWKEIEEMLQIYVSRME